MPLCHAQLRLPGWPIKDTVTVIEDCQNLTNFLNAMVNLKSRIPQRPSADFWTDKMLFYMSCAVAAGVVGLALGYRFKEEEMLKRVDESGKSG